MKAKTIITLAVSLVVLGFVLKYSPELIKRGKQLTDKAREQIDKTKKALDEIRDRPTTKTEKRINGMSG